MLLAAVDGGRGADVDRHGPPGGIWSCSACAKATRRGPSSARTSSRSTLIPSHPGRSRTPRAGWRPGRSCGARQQPVVAGGVDVAGRVAVVADQQPRWRGRGPARRPAARAPRRSALTPPPSAARVTPATLSVVSPAAFRSRRPVVEESSVHPVTCNPRGPSGRRSRCDHGEMGCRGRQRGQQEGSETHGTTVPLAWLACTGSPRSSSWTGAGGCCCRSATSTP